MLVTFGMAAAEATASTLQAAGLFAWLGSRDGPNRNRWVPKDFGARLHAPQNHAAGANIRPATNLRMREDRGVATQENAFFQHGIPVYAAMPANLAPVANGHIVTRSAEATERHKITNFHIRGQHAEGWKNHAVAQRDIRSNSAERMNQVGKNSTSFQEWCVVTLSCHADRRLRR